MSEGDECQKERNIRRIGMSEGELCQKERNIRRREMNEEEELDRR